MKKFVSMVLSIVILIGCVSVHTTSLALENKAAISKFDEMKNTSGFRVDQDSYYGQSTNGASQCKGFANKVAHYMFGRYLPTTDPSCYKFKDSTEWKPIHNTLCFTDVTFDNVKHIFYDLSMPADVVQMYWKASSTYSTVHTATIYSSDENGVYFYHYGDSLNNRKICLKYYTYSELVSKWNCSSNYGFTVYRSSNYASLYPSDTQPPVISNIKISKITDKGYTVTCKVTDNMGVKSVKFPTWKNSKGSNGCTWYNGTKNSDGTWSFTYKDATQSGKYTTHIYAYDEYGNSSSTSAGSTNITCKVAAPVIKATSVAGGKKITLTSTTKGSTIYYKTSKNGKYKKYSKAFKITSTKSIYAYAKKTDYKKSSTASKKITVNKLSAPAIGVKNIQGGKSVILKSSTKGTTIYYKTSKNGKYIKYSKPFSLTSSKTIYTYAKKSGYKNSTTVKKKISLSKLSKPTNVKATSKSSSSIKVTWKKVKNATKYQVFYSKNKNFSSSKSVVVTSTSATIKSLSSNKTYYFKVKSIGNGRQNSSYSKKVSAKTKKYNIDSKLKGTWRFIGEYLGDGDDIYEFKFDGKGKVKITVYGLDDVKSKTVKYSKSGKSVSFSAFGNKYTVSDIDSSRLYKLTIKFNSGNTYQDMLIKTSSVDYCHSKYIYDSNKAYDSAYKYFNGSVGTYWKSSYFKRSFMILETCTDYDYDWTEFVVFDGSDNDYEFGLPDVYIISKDVFVISRLCINGKYYSVILEKQSSNKMKAYIRNGEKIVKDTWQKENISW